MNLSTSTVSYRVSVKVTFVDATLRVRVSFLVAESEKQQEQEEQQAIAKRPNPPAPWEPRYYREERRVFYHNPTTNESC